MEFLRAYNPNLRRSVGLILSGLALSSCSSEALEIKANSSVVVIDKYNDSQLETTADTDENIRYKAEYWVVVEQCDRFESEMADENGCILMKTSVSESAYNNYEIHDQAAFIKDVAAYPIDQSELQPITSP